MKAVIMAGGEGTRLRPLTADMPKPLAPVLGESVMTHILRLLKRHGITDAAATLMFLPEQIKSKYGKKFEGVNLTYFEEKVPLGTAGSVKSASPFLLDKFAPVRDGYNDFFLVISGDAICDIDLSRAVDFHRSEQADITIVLTKSNIPLEFGGVLTENRNSGRIMTFIEKPAWTQVFTDTINTGIYIINNKVLDIIPNGKSYDFGKDLFPLMLQKNYKLCGYVDGNYWCDIGDLDAYYKCNMQATEGKIDIVKQSPNYQLIKNNIFIGENTKVADSAKITPYTIMGRNCVLNENISIENSIIHDNVKIGQNVIIKNAIICDGAEIGDNVTIGEGCVIGQKCVINKFAKISNGVKIWNGKTIGERKTIMSNMIFSGIKQELFDDDGITGKFNDTLSPEYCVKIGTAAGIAASDKSRVGRVGVMYSQNMHHTIGSDENKDNVNQKNNISKLIKNSLLCGIVASGAKSYDFGEGFESLASFAAGHFRLDAMLFVSRIYVPNAFYDYTPHEIIKIFDRNTLNPSRPFERKFEAALSRDDYKYPVADELYETESFEGLKFLYFSEMLKSAKCKLNGFKVAVQTRHKKSGDVNKTGTVAHIIKKALLELSADVVESDLADLTLITDNDGFSLQAYDKSAKLVDFWHIVAVLLKDAAQNGETEISLPYTAPHALQVIAEQAGVDMLRYLSSAFDEIDSDVKAKSRIMSQLYLKDACFAAIRLCSVLCGGNRDKKTLMHYVEELPQFTSKYAEVNIEDENKTKIISELNAQIQKLSNIGGEDMCTCSICNGENNRNAENLRNTEGIKINYLNGFVHVLPKRAGGFKLIAEAVSTEAADEILHATDDRIKSIIEKS